MLDVFWIRWVWVYPVLRHVLGGMRNPLVGRPRLHTTLTTQSVPSPSTKSNWGDETRVDECKVTSKTR